jgi:hypothetical protein
LLPKELAELACQTTQNAFSWDDLQPARNPDSDHVIPSPNGDAKTFIAGIKENNPKLFRRSLDPISFRSW